MLRVHRRDVVTTDRDAADEAVRAVFPGISLGPDDDGGSFRFRHAVAGDGRLAVHSLELSGPARGSGTVPELVAVGRVHSGRFDLSYGRHEVDTTLPYLRPPGESEMRMHDASLELVTLDPSAFLLAAQRYEGSDRVVPIGSRAGATGPRNRAFGAAWRSAADRILATAADESAFASELVRDRLFDMTVRVILGAFPLGEGDGSADAGLRPEPQAVSRAARYIDDHVAEHIALADIAEAARLSVRGVQYAFQRHYGVTPLTYLRERRLDAVRLALVASDPAAVSVADVARVWGFAHLSRFAQAYRDRFGEYPSHTIRS